MFFLLLFTELDQRLSPGEISRVQPFVVVGRSCTSGGVYVDCIDLHAR